MPAAPLVVALGDQRHLRTGRIAPLYQALQHSRQLRVLTFNSTAQLQPHHLNESQAAVVFCDRRLFVNTGVLLLEKKPDLQVIIICPQGCKPKNPPAELIYLEGCRSSQDLLAKIFEVTKNG